MDANDKAVRDLRAATANLVARTRKLDMLLGRIRTMGDREPLTHDDLANPDRKPTPTPSTEAPSSPSLYSRIVGWFRHTWTKE